MVSNRTLLDAEDQNVFFVDWSRGAKDFMYKRARARVEITSEAVGNFVKFLHDNFKLKYENTTLIGFSLGAHIAGLAGAKVLNGKLGKVVGLDPAGPLFDVNESNNRLSIDSAQYTECLHTGYHLGIKEPICQVDVYFNSGAKQPGCYTSFGLSSTLCSHIKAIDFYTEATSNPKAFYGQQCPDLNSALSMNCKGEPGVFVGDPENGVKRPSGIFHVIKKQ
jgi:pimeloyl-ACP methyl ester carboxylesterase